MGAIRTRRKTMASKKTTKKLKKGTKVQAKKNLTYGFKAIQPV